MPRVTAEQYNQLEAEGKIKSATRKRDGTYQVTYTQPSTPDPGPATPPPAPRNVYTNNPNLADTSIGFIDETPAIPTTPTEQPTAPPEQAIDQQVGTLQTIQQGIQQDIQQRIGTVQTIQDNIQQDIQDATQQREENIDAIQESIEEQINVIEDASGEIQNIKLPTIFDTSRDVNRLAAEQYGIDVSEVRPPERYDAVAFFNSLRQEYGLGKLQDARSQINREIAGLQNEFDAESRRIKQERTPGSILSRDLSNTEFRLRQEMNVLNAELSNINTQIADAKEMIQVMVTLRQQSFENDLQIYGIQTNILDNIYNRVERRNEQQAQLQLEQQRNRIDVARLAIEAYERQQGRELEFARLDISSLENQQRLQLELAKLDISSLENQQRIQVELTRLAINTYQQRQQHNLQLANLNLQEKKFASEQEREKYAINLASAQTEVQSLIEILGQDRSQKIPGEIEQRLRERAIDMGMRPTFFVDMVRAGLARNARPTDIIPQFDDYDTLIAVTYKFNNELVQEFTGATARYKSTGRTGPSSSEKLQDARIDISRLWYQSMKDGASEDTAINIIRATYEAEYGKEFVDTMLRTLQGIEDTGTKKGGGFLPGVDVATGRRNRPGGTPPTSTPTETVKLNGVDYDLSNPSDRRLYTERDYDQTQKDIEKIKEQSRHSPLSGNKSPERLLQDVANRKTQQANLARGYNERHSYSDSSANFDGFIQLKPNHILIQNARRVIDRKLREIQSGTLTQAQIKKREKEIREIESNIQWVTQ